MFAALGRAVWWCEIWLAESRLPVLGGGFRVGFMLSVGLDSSRVIVCAWPNGPRNC